MTLRVLVACEFSGIVRDAFRRRGHDAVSCDLLPTERKGPHIQGNVLEVLEDGWDLMVAHPPCTHLCISGARWFNRKRDLQEQALDFVLALMNAPIPQIAIENPVGVIGSRVRPPSQVVQPYWFGDRDQKTTCLWLTALPRLVATNMVMPLMVTYPSGSVFSRSYDGYIRTGLDRGLERSRTPSGMAEAMAEQWGECRDYCWRSETGYRRQGNHRKSKLPHAI